MKRYFQMIILFCFLYNCREGIRFYGREIPDQAENIHIYDSIVNRISIFPGSWRPLYNSEQICWISPSWESEEYIYLDFPEAIFIDGKIIYLSHVSKRFPAMFNYQLPGVRWTESNKVLKYERRLDNFLSFGGEVKVKDSLRVGLKLWIKNNSDDTLKNIVLQTCSYLHQIKEFDIPSLDNKFIHVRSLGWIPLDQALRKRDSIPPDGKFTAGWRSGPKISDIPVIIAASVKNDHFVGMTWFENTNSFIGNPGHPCFHADPFFPDINPHEMRSIDGELFFMEGSFDLVTKEIENKFN